MTMTKRRVFISYHHKHDQDAVDYFRRLFSGTFDVFTDCSLDRAADSTNAEYLNQVCRDAIDGTSVTIVMLGLETGLRKFVDWEIRYTLFREHGLMAITRPGLQHNQVSLPDRLRDNILSGYAAWHAFPSSAIELWTAIENAASADRRKIDNRRERTGRNLSYP